MRRDFYTAAERKAQFDRLPPQFRQRIEAYRDGVNARVDHLNANPTEIPGEFPVTATPVTHWTTDDTLAVGVYLARTVPSGDGQELSNPRASDLLSGPVPGSGSKDVCLCRTIHGPVQFRLRDLGTRARALGGLAAVDTAKDMRDVRRGVLKLTWNENLMAADSRVVTWEKFKARRQARDRTARPGRLGVLRPPRLLARLRHHRQGVLRAAAARPRRAARGGRDTFAALSQQFNSPDPKNWRTPREMYDVSAQGAGTPPELPLFDRGTYEQIIELSP